MNLKYEDLVRLEGSFLKPTLEKVRKAVQTIFEGKTTRLVGSDFDKKIVFFVDKDLKTAKFEVNEDKVKIHSVEEVLVDSESFGQKFQSLMSEAIDLLSENKEADSKSKFNDAIEVLRRELSGDKTTIFDKRPPLCEHKVAVRKIKLFKENKKQIIKDLSKNLSDLMEGYYGKDVIKDSYFEVSLNEGKSNEVRTYEKEPSLLRKVDLAKKSAKTVDVKPIFENVQKWISENEEIFFLTSDKFKERLVEASKTNVSATKDKINEAVKMFNKMRSENGEFKKLANQILKEQEEEGNLEPEIGDDRNTEPDRDDLDDKVVSDVDRKSEEDKLGFMRQFVDILEKLLTKIKEVADDEEIQRRVDFAVDTINKAKEENRWDKDELAEIAKEAIELAAKVEGIEPIDTEISKRAEEEDSEAEMDRETISGDEGVPGSAEVGMEPEIGGEEIPGEEIPGEDEEEEDIFKPRKRGELDEEAVISPDGDITYGDSGGEPQEPEMEKLTCYGCEKDFSVEPDGAPSYKCPYCGEAVEGIGGEEDALSKAEYNPHPAEEELEEVPVMEDDGMGNADQSSVNEAAKMSTNPAVGKIENVGGTELADSGSKMSTKPNIQKKLMKNVEGSTEGIIDKSGEKMATNPAKGSQEVVDGTKLPSTGKKMSKKPNKGKMEYADGTKLPDSGKKMSKNPAVGKQEVVKGSVSELPDTGGKMSTFPEKGKIETLKEGVPAASAKNLIKKFKNVLPKDEAKIDIDDENEIDHEDMETPGEEKAEHMPGGEEFGKIEPGEETDAPVDIDTEAPVDTEVPVDTDVSPVDDIAPIDTDTEAPIDTEVPVDVDTDVAPVDDVPMDMDTPPEAGIEIAVGGTGVDVAVDTASQTSGKLPDTGEQMSTNPPVGEVETLGEEGQPPTAPVANCPTCGKDGCGCEKPDDAGVPGDMNTPPIELEGCNPKKLKAKKGMKFAKEDIKKIRESIEASKKPKCNSCSKETPDLYEDPKTWGPMSNAGQEYLCLECMKRDFPYMVKETENVESVENVEEASYLPKDASVLGTYGSKSSPDRKYYIVKGKDGVTYCTCPSWKFSKEQPKCCKHLQDFTGGGSGKVTDENNEEFIREMNSPAIDPLEGEAQA